MSMRKIILAPGQLLRSVHMEKSYLSNSGYTLTGQNPPKVPPGQQKLMWTAAGVVHRGKVDPGVNELPRGNELSRDHVNRS